MGRPKTNHAYNYFKLNKEEGTSKCLLCGADKKTVHGANLLRHLLFYHKEAYQEVKENNRRQKEGQLLLINKFEIDSAEEETAHQQDNDSNESSDSIVVDKDEYSNNFKFLGRGRMPATRGYMTSHKKKHDKSANESGKDHSDNAMDEEENNYSEVIYLDEPFLNIAPSTSKRTKPIIRSSMPNYRTKDDSKMQKRKRTYSSPKEPQSQYDEECEKFGEYIIHLLKSTPRDVCSKLQLEIISLIMNEKIKMADNQKSAPTIVHYVLKNGEVTNDAGSGGNDCETQNLETSALETINNSIQDD